RRGANFFQPPALPTITIEVCRAKPFFQSMASQWPFRVRDGEPGRVPVLALYDHVVAKNPFELEAEAQSRPARGHVLGIAFPFKTTVAKIVHCMTPKQIERLGRRGHARNRRVPEDAADFNDAVVLIDPHERLPAADAPACF